MKTITATTTSIEQALIVNRANELINEFYDVREQQDKLLSDILQALQDFADILNEQAKGLYE